MRHSALFFLVILLSFNARAASKVSPKTANSDATVIQLSNVLQDFQKNTDEIRSKSTVPAKVNKKRIDCAASGDKTASGNSDTTVIQLSYVREDFQIETNQISWKSTLPAKINDTESEVSFKTAKSDATVIASSNLRENVFETSIQKCSGRTSSCCEEQSKFIFSGNKVQAIMATKPIICIKSQKAGAIIKQQTENLVMHQTVLSGLIASQSRTRGTQKLQFQSVTLSVKNGLFSIQKAPSVLIDFSRQKSLDLIHHLYIQHIRFVLFMCYDFADFSIPKIHRDDVLKELSNQIGKSAFHLRIELGASFYYIDGSFLKFLKTLAASLRKRNAGSKLPLTYFSIDELKRVNGGGDKYILKMSK